MPVDPDAEGPYLQAGWFGSGVKGLKRLVQGTTRLVSQAVQVTSSVAAWGANAAHQAKPFTLAIWDQATNPRSPAAMGARFAIDIVGVGDVIDIVHGSATGDWALVGLGVAGLALSVATVATGGAAAPLDASVSAAKSGLRLARSAGASDGFVRTATQAVKVWGDEALSAAKSGDQALAAARAGRLNRYADTIQSVAKEGQASMRGLEVLNRVEEPLSTIGRGVSDNQRIARLLGDVAAKRGDDAAQQTAAVFRSSGQVSLETASKAGAKASRYTPGSPEFLDGLQCLSAANVPGVSGVAASATKMAPKQGKGHSYVIAKACQNVGKEAHTLAFSRTLSNGKVIRPDEMFMSADGRVFREYKNYDGVFSLSTFKKHQLHHYAMLTDEVPGSAAEYVIKNGQVSKGVKDLVKELNKDALGNFKLKIRLLDDFGQPIT